MKSFQHTLAELQQLGSGVLEAPFEKLNAVLQSEKAVFFELQKQVSSKVDRVEFSEIVHQKASITEVQRIAMEMMGLVDAGDLQESNEYLINAAPPQQRKKRNRSAGAMRVNSYEPTANNSPMAGHVKSTACS